MRRFGLEAIVATSPVNVTYLTGYQNRLEVETKEFMLSPGGGNAPAFSSVAAASSADGGRARGPVDVRRRAAPRRKHLSIRARSLDLGRSKPPLFSLLAPCEPHGGSHRRRRLAPHSATGAPTPVRSASSWRACLHEIAAGCRNAFRRQGSATARTSSVSSGQ